MGHLSNSFVPEAIKTSWLPHPPALHRLYRRRQVPEHRQSVSDRSAAPRSTGPVPWSAAVRECSMAWRAPALPPPYLVR